MLRRTVLLGLLAAALVPASAHAAVGLVKVGTFSHPTYVTAPPGDTHRLFVVEQSGTIREVVDGVVQATPFLDLGSKVTYPGSQSDPEEGVLSMAFSPGYASNGRFFVYYTSSAGGTCHTACQNVVSEFTADSPDHASSSSEQVLITMPHPAQVNHNGGQLQFGPDGDLYISTGDGGGSNDTEGNAQKRTNLLGKILRIAPGATSYTIPSGNPFPGGGECSNLAVDSQSPTDCPEIWSYGLRNPWRFSFDRLNGDMIIGDVGQGAWEEIDFATPGQNAGANYGWPCYEGDDIGSPANPSECTGVTSGDVVNPVFEYSHSCSTTPFCGQGIIGGYVVRDPALPELYGRYLYGDLSSSASRGLRSIALPAATDDTSVPGTVNVAGLSSFGEDAAGCLYAASQSNGGVWRIAEAGSTSPGPCPVSSSVTPPPPPAGTDKTPPKLTLRERKRQRALRTHSISVGAVANELSTFSATATVKVAKTAKTLRFKRATRKNVAAGKRVTLKLRLSKGTLRALRRSMSHHRTRLAHVTVTARDAAGNARSRRVTIRLVH